MKFDSSNVAFAPEILKRKLGGELFESITLVAGAFTNGLCKAGTPINADGGKATTTSGTNNAVGILLYDVTDDNPVASIVKAYACVNASVGASHSGVTYDDALKTALNLITFE